MDKDTHVQINCATASTKTTGYGIQVKGAKKMVRAIYPAVLNQASVEIDPTDERS